MQFARPVIVISRCIDFDACRYNGQVIRVSLREELEPYVSFKPICPELEIGLGVPRDPIEIVERDGRRKLVQPSTGHDLTASMRSFSDRYLSGVGEVDGFILKSRSPSCAVSDARIHCSETSARASAWGPGMFAERVLERFPLAAVEDEARLADAPVREHFLTRVFTLAGFREAVARGTMKALLDFHSRNELLLMAHGQDGLREADQIVANEEGLPAEQVAERYFEALAGALSRRARLPSNLTPFPEQLAR
jgi:uncharacterized protein YbbK (DUF523 family)